MTNDEAIKWLIAIEERYIYGGDEAYDKKRKIAIQMAINALLEPKKGHWIPIIEILANGDTRQCGISCDQCAYIYNGDDFIGTPFCPECGADMREES